VNVELQEVNSRLSEANKLKKNISVIFHDQFRHTSKNWRLKSSIEQKLSERAGRYPVLSAILIFLMKSGAAKTFDKAFLNIPSFVEEFNPFSGGNR
jgi:hypothetical protein